MREIIFKGKRIDNGEWVEGAYYKQTLYYGDPCEKHYIITSTESLDYDQAFEYYEVEPETVGRYTGITDKNGKKIFEGDILYSPLWWWGPRFVYLMQGECGPCYADSVMQYILASNVENPEHHASYNLWNGCEVEIVGNVHDNPELIKEV